MAYSLSPWLKPRFFITGTNRPLAGGLMYTYKAGTTDPATTYSDDAGTTNTNPIVLDSDGQCDLFLDDAVSYRIILKNSAGVTQFDKDRIASLGSTQVQSFNSIAALRLRSGTTIANAAKTLGYYSAGDGGGNSFYWDSTSTATDNAGTVIKPTAVSGAGRWLAVDTSYINVKQFGAVGDGVADDTVEIQAALTSSLSGTVVSFPASSVGYKISNNLNVPLGVNINGGGKVLRTHGLSVSNYAFTLNGSNKISGLVYDGGFLTIATPGLALSIKDFRVIGNDVSFTDNTFSNSCGSYVDFTNNQYITTDTLQGLVFSNNIVGDYADHVIYCQGYNLIDTGNITISSNIISATSATTTRQAFKLKNINRATLSNNSFNIPYGVFCTVEVGLDAALTARDCEKVAITGNSGLALRFIESIADLSATNRGYMIQQLTITGNSAICTGAVISIGLTPQDATVTYATRCKKVVIANNTLVGTRFIINGDINGVNNGIEDLTISNNSINITSGDAIFQIVGNVYNLNITGNTMMLDTAYAADNAVINRKIITDSFSWSTPTIVGYFNISGNKLLGGFGAILSEQPSSAITTINFSAVLDGNIMINANTYRTVILTSSVIGTATGRVYAQNNKFFGGTLAAPACTNYALYTETDDSKRYVDPATTTAKQGGRSAVYVCSADLSFDPLTLGAGVYYHAYKKTDGTYVRVA